MWANDLWPHHVFGLARSLRLPPSQLIIAHRRAGFKFTLMRDEIFPGSRETIFELFFANLAPIYKGRKEIKWCLFRYCIKLHISIGEKWNKKCFFSRWDSFCRDYKYIVGPGYKAQMNIQKISKSRQGLKFVHNRCFSRR